MSRYIDAFELKEQLYAEDDDFGYCTNCRNSRFCEIINNQPTSDVKEVVHGEWIWDDFSLRCSICGVMQDYRYNFCPHCGADMRGDSNE